MNETNGDPRDIATLLAIMARLRDPDGGCPWDLQQTFATIAPYTIEEAYEVADAIDRNDLPDLRDELGDLLLQVVFHARMAQEQGAFGFDWPGPVPVIAKLHEEIEEVRVEFDAVAADPADAAAQDRLEEELGDVLFVCANLARHAKVDVGAALRRANAKFEARFRAMEALAAADGGLAGKPLDEQDRYWAQAKAAEKEAKR
jgi:uncharacterized protein YabN with tetrapyrrole methylase and pyrophosphatase domain